MKVMAMWVAIVVVMAMMAGAKVEGGKFNITDILSKYPEFGNFNRLLTETHVADEINRHRTITVLAMDDGAVQPLLSGNMPMREVADILRYHVILQYFGDSELETITNSTTLATTLYQTTGRAVGNLGSLNLTVAKNGTVGIGVPVRHPNLTSTVVKSLQEIPYNISVLQVSSILLPIGVGAPIPAPAPVPSPAPTPALTPVPASSPVPSLAPASVTSPPADAVAGPAADSPPNHGSHLRPTHAFFVAALSILPFILT